MNTTPASTFRSAARFGHATRALALLLVAMQGACLSHEYEIPKEELSRIVTSAPERRGDNLRVVQEIGVRRAPALDPNAPPPVPMAGGTVYTDRGVVTDHHVGTHVMIGTVIHSGGGGRSYGRGPMPPAQTPVVAGAVGQQVAPTAAVGGGAVTPTAPVGPSMAPTAPAGAPAATSPLPVGVGQAVKKGNNNDDLVAYAVIAIAVAGAIAIGSGVTEGMRFDGNIATSPYQLVYLQDGRGGERPVPLADLTPADVAASERAVLRDDEGYGIVRGDRAPLNRKGFAFKFDFGGIEADIGTRTPTGFASHIQLGYFPWQRFGILAGVALGGAGGEQDGFARHSLNLEAQLFPINLWRLHLGGFVNGGSAVAPSELGNDAVWGLPAVGAGALLEIELTTRLALTARFGWSAARNDDGNWANARTLSAGIAVY